MSTSFAVIGGDRRQTCLAQQLRAAGFTTGTYRVPGLPDSASTLNACVRNAKVLLLPFPAFDADGNLRAAGEALPLSDILSAAQKNTAVFGGLSPFSEKLRAHGLRGFDYAADETLLLENAELTAEVAVPLLLSGLDRPLARSQILLCGFGRIGTLLARKLQARNARVTVAARKPQTLALARIAGFSCENIHRLPDDLSRYDAIVNTVPAVIIHEAQLSSLRADCFLLELASLPGGFCPQAQTRAHYLAARGLPGRCAPEAAAEILRRFIFRSLSLEETS